MDWSSARDLSKEWSTKTHRYVAAINGFVAKGLEEGWEAAGEQPVDDRDEALGARVTAVLQEANEAGQWRDLHERFPRAQAPFVPILQERAVGIHQVAFLGEDRVVATVGSPWMPEAVPAFDFEGEVEHAPEGALGVGTSPDRRQLALLYPDHVRVLDGWKGAELGRFPRLRGDEDAPAGAEPPDSAPVVMQMVVMPGGGAVVLATSHGVFLSRGAGVTRVSPDSEQLAKSAADEEESEIDLSTDMTHLAVNAEGTLTACGHQSSQHELRRPDGTLVGVFGPLHSEYPHHATFSPDGQRLIVNSCHFYDGVTSIGRVEELVGLDLGPYDEDIGLLPLQEGARVYDSAWRDDQWLLGDAHGSVRVVTSGGDRLWQHFIGSSIGGVDVSPSGDRLAQS